MKEALRTYGQERRILIKKHYEVIMRYNVGILLRMILIHYEDLMELHNIMRSKHYKNVSII
jgi:hypothetical protein